MNAFIQWQETISDAYLTDTPLYFPFIELNISFLPQGSLVVSDVSKQVRLWCTCTKQLGAPARNTGHVDVVGSVNTIRLSRIDVVGSVNTIRLRR